MLSQRIVQALGFAAVSLFLVGALTGCPLLFGGGQAGTVMFIAAPSSGPAPLAVRFHGMAALTPPYEVAGWSWDFGDGSTGNGRSTAHTYTVPGTYMVTLQVAAAAPKFRGEQDPPPATLEYSQEVNVLNANTPPVANAGPDQSVFLPTGAQSPPVTLDGSASYDPDDDPLTYAWQFVTVPQGSASALTGADTVNPTFVPDRKGDYVIQLIVNDGTLDSAPDTVVVTVGNRPPVANAGLNQSLFLGGNVTLDGSDSSDPDGDSLTYAWTVATSPAGSTPVLTGAGTVSPTFTADRKGDYVIELTVEDDSAATDADTVVVTILNRPPLAEAGLNQTMLVDEEVTLDGSNSTDPDLDPLTYAWTVVTSPAGSTPVLTGADTVGPTFSADRKGDYVIELTVEDDSAATDSDTVVVTIGNRPPTAVGVVLPGTEDWGNVYRNTDSPVLTPNLETLYGLPRYSEGEKSFGGDLNLMQIDPDTANVLGLLPITLIMNEDNHLLPIRLNGSFGLAVDPTTGEMWAIVDFSRRDTYEGPFRALVRVNPYTGVAVPVGDPFTASLADLYAGLAVDDVSVIYGVTGNRVEQTPQKVVDTLHALYMIDSVTTLDTFVFQFPELPDILTPGEVIAFNTDDGLMYHASGNTQTPASRLFEALDLDTPVLTGLATPVEEEFWNRPTAMTYAPGTGQFYLADVKTESPFLFRITVDAGTATEEYIGEIVSGQYNESAVKGLAFLYERGFPAPEVTLDGSQSSDPDGDFLTYAWQFVSVPQGSALINSDLSDPYGVTTSFTPDVLGTYELELTVYDDELSSDTATVTVNYLNMPPVANAGDNQVYPPDLYYSMIQLNGGDSYDPDGTQLTFEWTFLSVPTGSTIDDSSLDTTYAAPSLYVDVASSTEPYVLQLTVTDADGATSTATVQLLAEEVVPSKK